MVLEAITQRRWLSSVSNQAINRCPRSVPPNDPQALSDGKTRQILRLSLPLIGATEMDDWPGGDRQRYKACGPMVKTLLLGNEVAEV